MCGQLNELHLPASKDIYVLFAVVHRVLEALVLVLEVPFAKLEG